MSQAGENNSRSGVSRRDFFKIGATAGAVVTVAGIFSTLGQTANAAEEGRRKKDADNKAGGAGQLCDPNSGMAKGMNYQNKHADVKDAKLKVEKQGLKFESQFCNNCSFYTKKSNVNGEEAGSCQVLQGCLVAGKGWCSTWNKKG